LIQNRSGIHCTMTTDVKKKYIERKKAENTTGTKIKIYL
jgi:hypothetical protein